MVVLKCRSDATMRMEKVLKAEECLSEYNIFLTGASYRGIGISACIENAHKFSTNKSMASDFVGMFAPSVMHIQLLFIYEIYFFFIQSSLKITC